MSLKYKLENAFAQLLERKFSIGFAGGDRIMQILTSQMASDQTLGPRRIIIQALSGHPISPKARVLRMQAILICERLAIPNDSDPDEEDPTLNHSRNVDAAHAALDDDPIGLAAQLTREINDFTVFGVVPMGEVHDPPNLRANCLRDTWGYTCTCCEADCD